MGHLGKDAETKHLGSGKAITEFSVAVSEKRKDEKVTSWFAVKVWGDLPDWKVRELTKGALVMVAGRLSVETWEKDGRSGSKTVITADPYNGVNVFGNSGESGGGMVPQPRAQQAQSIGGSFDDESIPF